MMQFCFLTVVIKDFTKKQKAQGETHPDSFLWGASQVPCTRFHYEELEKSGQQTGFNRKAEDKLLCGC